MLTPTANNRIPMETDDDATVVTSNLSSDFRECDNVTVETAPSTDESHTETAVAGHSRAPITIPHMILPWGGIPSTNKATGKHRRRLERREQRRAETARARESQQKDRERRKYKS